MNTTLEARSEIEIAVARRGSEVVKPDRAGYSSAIMILLLGIALLATNHWFTAVDDEIAIIDKAAQPVSKTLDLFLSGAGEHEHPPLWDLILHGWLRLTGGEVHLLRVLPIFFYLLGAWALAKAARRLGGPKSQLWVAALILLWPYGFHFGRLAAWYSFSFFVVSILTWAYLNYAEQRNGKTWFCMTLASLALVYCNYFGWAMLACLAVDFLLRTRKSALSSWRPVLGTGVLLCVAYLPLAAAFLHEVRVGSKTGQLLVVKILAGAYNLYCLFISESVAPWIWVAGAIGGMAIAAALVSTLWVCPPPARRFLLYFMTLLVALSILGVVSTKRAMLIAPWLVAPFAVTLGTLADGRWRRTLVASLLIIAGIGWYGILARNLYAAPRWVEPWERVAQRAAAVVGNGGVAIGDHPAFFFYLTYLLPAEVKDQPFRGLLPYSVHRAGVFTPQQWLEATHPAETAILFTKGVHYGMPEAPIVDAKHWLDQNCMLKNDERFVPDSGKPLKDRYAPEAAQPEWRVEVWQYSCQRQNAGAKARASGSVR